MKVLRFLVSIIAFSLLSNSGFSDLESNELKDLNLLTPEFWELDPTHGFPLVEGGGLENMSFAVEAELEKLVGMISTLFNRVNPDEFNVSTPGEKGASSLHPKIIGKILGLVKVLQLENRKDRSQVLWKAFYGDDRVQATIARLRAQSCDYLEESNREGISEEENKSYLKKAAFFSPDNPFKPRCIRDSSVVPKALKKKFLFMTKAFWEENLGPYPIFVFLSLLWKKLEKRSDVLEYYLGLHEGFLEGQKTKLMQEKILNSKVKPKDKAKIKDLVDAAEEEISIKALEALNSLFPLESQELLKKYRILIKSGEEDSDLTSWLNATYSEGNFPEPPAKENYADALFWLTMNVRDSFHLEQQEKAHPFKELANFSFPDCGATLAKNFFKIFLDTHQIPREGLSREKDYDVRILKELGAEEEVIRFFDSSFSNRSLQKTQKARNEWGRITCDRAGVEYVTPPQIPGHKCEIDVGQKNLLAFINTLLFQNKDQTKAQSWEELGQRIQAARIQVWGEGQGDFSFGTWIGKNGNDNFGHITLLAQGYSAGFELVFQEGHFFVTANPKGQVSFSGLMEVMGNRNPEGIKALNLYSLLPYSQRKTRDLFLANKKSASPFLKYFIKLSSHNESINNYMGEFADLRLSSSQYYEFYRHFKEKRIGDNIDLRRRVYEALYQDSPELFVKGLEEAKDFRMFPLSEFESIYSSLHESRAGYTENLLNKTIPVLERLLSFSFQESHPFLDPIKGRFFFTPRIQDKLNVHLQEKELEVSPDGRYFASWMEDYPVVIYDIRENRSTLVEDVSRIRSLHFSSDSKRFRILMEGRSAGLYSNSLLVKSWNLESKDFSKLNEETEKNITSFHPTGYIRKSPVDGFFSGYILSYDKDSSLRLYKEELDWSKVDVIRFLKNMTERDIRFSWDWQRGDDNKILISFLEGSSAYPEGRTFNLLSMVKNPEDNKVEIKENLKIKINSLGSYLALSPQGNFALMDLTKDYKREENSSEGRALLISLEGENRQIVLPGSDSPLKGVRFTSDGHLAVTWDEMQNVYFWSIPGGELVYTLNHPRFDRLHNLRFTPDGKHLIAQTQSFIKVWDLCKLDPEVFAVSCSQSGAGKDSHEDVGAGSSSSEVE